MLQRNGRLNAHLSSKETDNACRLRKSDQAMLDKAMHKLGLSARGYYKILKIARTIADLSGTENIATAHLKEAMAMRRLDRRSEWRA